MPDDIFNINDQHILNQYCSIPFYNIAINKGQRSCCLIPEKELEQDLTLIDAFHSKEFETIRSAFRKGEQYPGCKECWANESTGQRSARQGYNAQLLEHLSLPKTLETQKSPRMVQLMISNTCNYACRTCSLGYSTGWLTETRRLAEQGNVDAKKELEDHKKMPWNFKKANEVLDQIESVQWLELLGGETLLARGVADFLGKLCGTGHAEHISLVITTNGSIPPRDDLIRMFDHFRDVRITFSIDAVTESAFKYIRTGNWKQVNNNITYWMNHQSIKFFANPTLSILNLWHLDELLEWLDKRFGPTQIGHNWVINPPYYNVTIMPDHIKEAIESTSTYWHSKKFIPYMWSQPHNPKLWSQFLKHTEWLDKSRSQPMKESMPELYKLMNIET